MEKCVTRLRAYLRHLIVAQGDCFPGLVNLVENYLDTLDIMENERRKINSYLSLVRRRANGLPLLSLILLYSLTHTSDRISEDTGDMDSRFRADSPGIQVRLCRQPRD